MYFLLGQNIIGKGRIILRAKVFENEPRYWALLPKLGNPFLIVRKYLKMGRCNGLEHLKLGLIYNYPKHFIMGRRIEPKCLKMGLEIRPKIFSWAYLFENGTP